eukprot:3746492-Rhodomonas_salina.2
MNPAAPSAVQTAHGLSVSVSTWNWTDAGVCELLEPSTGPLAVFSQLMQLLSAKSSQLSSQSRSFARTGTAPSMDGTLISMNGRKPAPVSAQNTFTVRKACVSCCASVPTTNTDTRQHNDPSLRIGRICPQMTAFA